MYKILLLEDDEILAQTIGNLLKSAGYYIDISNNYEDALEFTYNNEYELYLFDINIPNGNGIDLLKELRDSGDNTPTFFITAMNDIKSISKGFRAGCDDYIKKPFDFDELLVRIEAKLRVQEQIVTYKDIVYDPKKGTVLYKGEEISAGNVTKEVLILFITNQGRVIKKDDILELMYNPSNGALKVLINKIKQQFNLDIVNIRAVGYKLEKL